LHNTLVVLVRATDKLPASTNPMSTFKGRVLGAPQGNSFITRLRESGLTIDDGGRDLDRNIEKLKLGRVDGVVVNVGVAGPSIWPPRSSTRAPWCSCRCR
jgi:hypothetical protein